MNNNYNYLITLPSKRDIGNMKEEIYYINLINKIINSSDNKEDYNLLKFKYQLIDYIIINLLNLTSDFNKENYFLLRKNITILNEIIIKDSSQQLLRLLIKDNKEIHEIINTLNSLYDFKCSYQRVEIIEDNKKKIKIIPKTVVKEDIYLYIDELSQDVFKHMGNIINEFVNNNDVDSYLNLEKIVFDDIEIRNKIFNSLNKRFEFLNNEKLLIIKEIMDNYNKNYLSILKKIIIERKRLLKSNDLSKKRKLDSTFEFYEKRRNYSYVYKI